MTHQAYTEQQLQTKTLTDLKTIYTQIGATVEITDKRRKSDWVNAIFTHQSKAVSVAPTFVTESSQVKAKAKELSLNLIQVKPRYYIVSDVNRNQSFIIKDTYDAFDPNSDAENPYVVEICAKSVSKDNQKISCHPSAVEALESLAKYLSEGILQEEQEIIDPNFQANYDKAITAGFIFTQEAIGHDNGIRWVARLGQYKCHNSKLSAVASLAAQYIGSPLHQRHINQTQDHNTRLENNRQGYKDATAGLAMQSNDPCYRVGYDRGIRDTRPQTEDTSSDAITFEEIGKNIYGKIWQATVNNIEIRIIPVNGGYKSNLTGDRLLTDFGIAVKETLLAVAKLQQAQQTEEMEIYTTATPGVYAVYSHKPNQTNRYEVNLTANTCTCPHYQHRHHQEGFQDKHINHVRAALTIRTTPPIREEEMLLDKPIDELTAADLKRLASYNPLPELVAA